MSEQLPAIVALDEVNLPMDDDDFNKFRINRYGSGRGVQELQTILDRDRPLAILFRSPTDLREGVFRQIQHLIEPSSLKALIRLGVGMDKVFQRGFTEAGVEVINTPDANREATADLTMRCLQAGMGHGKGNPHSLQSRAREQLIGNESVKKMPWDTGALDTVYGPISNLVGQKVGVICCGGEIGGRVTDRLLDAGAQVYGWNRTRSKIRHKGDITVVDNIGDLIGLCDMVTVHASMDDGSARGLVGKDFFELMQEHSLRCLVNTARAEVVDEEAMYTAIERGDLHNAQLDVVGIEGPALLGDGPASNRLSCDQRRHLSTTVMPLLKHPHVNYLFHSAGEEMHTRTKNQHEALQIVRRIIAEAK